MLNLEKYRFEGSDLIRRTDRQFDKVWRELRGSSLDDLASYTSEDGEIVVPFALRLGYNKSSLNSVVLDRMPVGHPCPPESFDYVLIHPQHEEAYERQEVRAAVYARHILNCVIRSKGDRPLFAADEDWLFAASDMCAEPGFDRQKSEETAEAVRFEVLHYLAEEEFVARASDSNHQKLERIRLQQAAA